MSFTTGTQAELLYTLNAPVTKASAASLAVISAVTTTAPVAKIQGGFLADNPNPIGRAFYLKAFGTLNNAATAATFIPSLGVDPTAGTPANTTGFCTAVTPTASTTEPWDMEAWLTCTAAAETGGTTFQVNGNWSLLPAAVGGALSTAMQQTKFGYTVTGLLSSTTYYIELCATWSATGATTTVQQLFFWGLN
jgi:hypothetical protein